MILSALLLSLQAAPAAQPEPEPIPEIVVLGRLRSLQVTVGQDRKGNWNCSLSGSTGRPRLDDKFCRAATKCVRKGAKETGAIEKCIRKSRNGLVKQFERAMKKTSK